jgi:hypothetical protein
VGTTFTFSVNQPVTMKFAFKRSTSTHTLLLRAPAGTDKLTFQGRISSRVKLAPGSYTVTATATNASGSASAAKSLSFTIVS